MSAVTLVRPNLGRRGVPLVRPSLGSNLALLTPKTTMDRARALELKWTALTNAVTRQADQQRLQIQWRELFPVRQGWMEYYLRLRTNKIAQAAEYGELEQWERHYMRLRTQFKTEGLDVSNVPVIAVGATPGAITIPEQIEVKIDPGETPEAIRKKAQEASEQFVADLGALIGRVALYGAGILVVGAGILWLVNRSKKGTATAGMERVNVKHLTPAQSRKRIRELRRKGCRVRTEVLPDGSLLVLKTCPKGVSGLGLLPKKHLVQAEHRLRDFERMIEMFGRHVRTKNCTMASRYLSEAYEARGKTDAHASSTIFDKNATDNEIGKAEDILRRDSKMNEKLSRLRTRFEIDCLE